MSWKKRPALWQNNKLRKWSDDSRSCYHNQHIKMKTVFGVCPSFISYVFQPASLCAPSLSVSLRLSACLCIYFVCCRSARSSVLLRGRLRSPRCPFWSFLTVVTKGYVPRVSTAKRALVSQQKNLCYVTHWCCRCWCCSWQWSRAGGRRRRGGGWESDRDRELVKWAGEERWRKKKKCVCPFSAGWAVCATLPTSCIIRISVLCVLSCCSPFSLYTEASSIQQHDITD